MVFFRSAAVRRLVCLIACFAAALTVGARASSAGFFLSNLDPNDSLNTAGGLLGFESSGAISVGFKVLAPTVLTSVDMKLRANTGSSLTKDATLVLRANDNAGNPGDQVTTFNSVALGTSFQTATFIPTTTVTLTAGSTYWLTLGTTISAGVDNDGLVAGSRNPAVDPSGTDGEFVGLRLGTPDTQFASPLFTAAPSIQITGISAVPEPASTGLFISVAAGMYLARRRAKRSD